MLYRDAVSTGCGNASSAVGPFYCPADQRVYLDLSFYGDMQRQLGAPGDFAWAYVIAHEVGHHVQQQLGTSDEVSRLRREHPGPGERAVGAPRAPGRLLRRRLGAQRLRRRRPREGRRATRPSAPPRPSATTASSARRPAAVNPDSFTHGTSEQRTAWFEPRPRERRPGRLRHVLAGQRLAAGPSSAFAQGGPRPPRAGRPTILAPPNQGAMVNPRLRNSAALAEKLGVSEAEGPGRHAVADAAGRPAVRAAAAGGSRRHEHVARSRHRRAPLLDR